MSSKKDAMKKKLENMHLGERINYGYRMVITMMLISGLLSIAVIGVLFFNMLNYVNKVNAADQAVKTCRINVNAAARNVREMALNPDKSTYDDYEQGAKEKLEDVDVQLKTIKKSGIVPEDQYNEYSKALSDWANIGYSIMDKIKAGQKDEAVDQIINECTPKLNKTVELAKEINKLTDERSHQAVVRTYVCAAVGLIVIIICLICAWQLTKRTGKIVLDTILEPLHAIEEVAKELTEGNLHSTLDYRSEDEIGRLAHSMRKSIRILGSYVDDIDRSMKLFADGHVDATNFTLSHSSDRRLKDDINELDEKLINTYMSLKPSSYVFKDDGAYHKDGHEFGLIAQDIIQAFTDNNLDFNDYTLVNVENTLDNKQKEILGGDDHYYSVDYDNLHALHILVNKNQEKRIQILENEIENLKKELREINGK